MIIRAELETLMYVMRDVCTFNFMFVSTNFDVYKCMI
jgi:hypothetical protein